MLYFVNEIVPWIIFVVVITIIFEAILRKVWKVSPPEKLEPEPQVHPTRLSACETTNAISVHLRQMEDYELPNFAGRSGVSTTLCKKVVGWDNKFGIGEVTCSFCIKEALRRYPDEIMLGNGV